MLTMIPLVEEDLIPPLHPSLVLWGEGQKSGEVAVRRCSVTRGKEMGGGGGTPMGQLMPGPSTKKMTVPRGMG